MYAKFDGLPAAAHASWYAAIAPSKAMFGRRAAERDAPAVLDRAPDPLGARADLPDRRVRLLDRPRHDREVLALVVLARRTRTAPRTGPEEDLDALRVPLDVLVERRCSRAPAARRGRGRCRRRTVPRAGCRRARSVRPAPSGCGAEACGRARGTGCCASAATSARRAAADRA